MSSVDANKSFYATLHNNAILGLSTVDTITCHHCGRQSSSRDSESNEGINDTLHNKRCEAIESMRLEATKFPLPIAT